MRDSPLALMTPAQARRRPPHVLYLIDTFHRTTGGAERALINIVHYLSPERYRCSVATLVHTHGYKAALYG